MECPLCGNSFTARALKAHQDDATCRASRLIKDLEAIDLIAPGSMNVETNTVKMLAKHAGVVLEKYPIRWRDNGSDWQTKMLVDEVYKDDVLVETRRIPVPARYTPVSIYVAPTWLCKIASAWRRGNGTAFPKRFLAKLRDARDDERVRATLITQLTLLNPKRRVR